MPKKAAASIDWRGYVATGLLISAISWASTTFSDMYREGGAQRQHNEDLRLLKEMRDRELDDIKQRLLVCERPHGK